MGEKRKIDLDFDLDETMGFNLPLDEVEKRMKIFLLAYLKYGVKTKARNKAGMSHPQLALWLEMCPGFKEKFDEIHEEFVDEMEYEANRRAMEKSDSLLQFLLRANRPEKFNPTYNVRANIESEGGIKLMFREDELNEEEKKLLMGDSNEE